MKYLFFDIECSDGAHICEFGYVLCDENFCIEEKKCLCMNPDAPFCLRRPGDKNDEIKLFFTEDEYRRQPLFTRFYEEIKSLITAPETKVLGYALHNDAGFIKNACERYDLMPIDFVFYDVQKMFSEKFCEGEKNPYSLEKALDKVGVDRLNLHKSDDDAEMTMKLLQKMCISLGTDIEETISQCSTCVGRSENFVIEYLTESLPFILETADSDETKLSKSCKARVLRRLLAALTSERKAKDNPLKGKSVCFGMNIEENDFRSTLILVRMIYRQGGSYVLKSSKCDFFVRSAENVRCPRYESVKRSGRIGKKTTVLSFEDFLTMLGLTREDLDALPLPPESDFDRYEKKIRSYQSGSSTIKIGDILQGRTRS